MCEEILASSSDEVKSFKALPCGQEWQHKLGMQRSGNKQGKAFKVAGAFTIGYDFQHWVYSNRESTILKV